MRRDHFTLEVSPPDADGDGMPALVVEFDGPSSDLLDRLEGSGGGPDEVAVDVAFRLLDDVDAADATGVLSVTDRVTGEFVLELNAPAREVTEFVRAARAAPDDGDADRYRLVLRGCGDELATLEKRTFLVYDVEGGLLRAHSLIPSGVEL